MISIKKLAIALAISVAATTSAFAMQTDSVYDDARYTAGKTYYKVIEEATIDTLSLEDAACFMNFVRSYPTQDLNHYDMNIEMGWKHPRYEDRVFFREMAPTVEKYAFPKNIAMTPEGKKEGRYSPATLAHYDLFFALRGIVDGTSHRVVGTTTD